jgi:hypothetical protein
MGASSELGGKGKTVYRSPTTTNSNKVLSILVVRSHILSVCRTLRQLSPENCPHFQEPEVSTPDDPAAKTEYTLNVLAAFAIKEYWKDVREQILRLADGDETVPVKEVLRIIDEPVAEIVQMFNNAAKAAHGT